jgi:acetate kinase
VRRIVREIGSLAAALGGLDMLAFTAGVGEHSAALRERICGALGWLGLLVDDTANQADAATISIRTAGPRRRWSRPTRNG